MKTRFWFFDNGKYGMGEEELPPLKDNQLLVKTTRTLVSVGTETSVNTGKPSWNKGRHGYSYAGVAVEVGKDVPGIREGDRIVASGNHCDFAVFTVGNEWQSFYRTPDGVNDDDATYMILATVALHIVERGCIKVGQPVVVTGQGTVGQMGQQLARIAGAGFVVAVDIDEKKLELSKKLGADAGIKPDKAALDAALKGVVTNSPPPVFLELSGSTRAIEWITASAPPGSRIVIAGNYIQNITINPAPIVNGELVIAGGFQPADPLKPVYGYPHCKTFNHQFVLECIRNGRLKVGDLCDGHIRPEELIPFYDAVRDGKPRQNQPIIDWD